MFEGFTLFCILLEMMVHILITNVICLGQFDLDQKPDKIEAIDLRHHLVTFVNGDVEEYAAGRQRQLKMLM